MQGEPDEQATIALLRRSVEEVAGAVLPIIETGAGPNEHIASAFVLDCAGVPVVVTAAHALEGEREKALSGPIGAIKLGPRFRRLQSSAPTGPDFDIAFVALRPEDLTRIGVHWKFPFGPEQILPAIVPGHLFVGMGHPVSRSDMRRSGTTLESELTVLTMNALDPAILPNQPRLDPAVHVGLRYERRRSRNPDGVQVTGAFPRGMSGGPLLRPRWSDASKTSILLDLVGVIIEYHERKQHQLIASRLTPLLPALTGAGLVETAQLPRGDPKESSVGFVLGDG